MVLKRVGPVSLAKIAGTLYAVLGLFIGAIVSLIASVGFALKPPEAPAVFGLLFGVGAVVLVLLIYGCLGFLMALIMAGLYNLLAGMVGGYRCRAKSQLRQSSY